LALEGVDDVEGGDGLALGVLSVGDGVTDDTLEEGLEDTAGLFVDHGRDTLDTATTSETTDSRLGDALDVVTKNLAMALGSTLAEALSALSASSHDEVVYVGCVSGLEMEERVFLTWVVMLLMELLLWRWEV